MASRNVLLVEGNDDEHVVKNLCGYHHLPQIDQITQCGGISKLLESLPIQLKGSDIHALGVLVDADTDMKARWNSLQGHLNTAGFTAIPTAPVIQGTILFPPPGTLLPKVGIWLMPDNKTNGILEDFLRSLMPMPNTLFAHAQKSIDDIPVGQRPFAAKDAPKALIHTWLAWQQEPGKPFGTAIKAGYLDASYPLATDFTDWINQLFFR